MPGQTARDRHQPSSTQSSESEEESNDISEQSVVSATDVEEDVDGLDVASYPPDGDYAEEEEDEDEEEEALEVVVETLLGETYRVRVSQWDTPAGLKDLLFRTQGIPPSQQHLVLGERELVEEMCLMEQGVVEGSRLRLVVAMKDGPVNTRRLPSQDDLLWQDFTDYIDVNKDELWEGVGGRTVTLLVLREGENVNLYRVVENVDGSYSPLNESWGSLASGRGMEEVSTNIQISEEDARTKERVADLMQRMEELKLRKNKRQSNKTMLASGQVSLNNSLRALSDAGDDLASPRLDMPEGVGSRRALATPLTTPLHTPRQRSGRRLSNAGRRGGRGSRPSTQERAEFSRASFTRTTLKEIPMANPPVPVDFTRRKPLDGIRPQANRLSAVNEDRGRGDSPLSYPPETPTTKVQNRHYDSYRKSIVEHSKGFRDKPKNSPEAWPRRDASKPPFMLSESQVNRYDRDRLNRSHNQALLRSFQHTATKRPKTSPEVLERRPGSGGQQSTLSERIHLRAPDDRLRELCSILGSPPGRASQLGSPTDTMQPPSLSTSFSGSNNNPLVRSTRTNSVSVSLASLRSRGGTPPTPGRGALVTSGSREHRETLRGLMRSQGGVSRRTTPDQGPIPVRRPPSSKGMTRRPSSGKGNTHLPPVTPQRRRTRRRKKCEQCSRHLNITTTYECRCGGIFCAQHRYAETHTCTFDYRTAGRNLLTLANPLVAPNKLPKI